MVVLNRKKWVWYEQTGSLEQMEATAITLVRWKQRHLLRQSQTSQLRSGYAGNVSIVVAPLDKTTLAVIDDESVVVVTALLFLSDSEKHCQLQAEKVSGSDKEVMKEYFNNFGF
ncbi:magnesium protoporphyrin IX methyltransferase [Sarracenia purpurea var. burkii]